MTIVKERPILLSGAMVRAILEGRKTQTRRVVRDQPPAHMNIAVPYLKPDDGPQQWCFTGPQLDATGKPLPIEQWEGGWPDCSPAFVCPHGDPGSHLWVRETLKPSQSGITVYGEDGCPAWRDGESVAWPWPKARVITYGMPRWASRITLELTDVRVQRVQEVSEEDARAEGVDRYVMGHGSVTSMDVLVEPGYAMYGRFRTGFEYLWDSINADRGFGWDVNPWVWALTFRRLP